MFPTCSFPLLTSSRSSGSGGMPPLAQALRQNERRWFLPAATWQSITLNATAVFCIISRPVLYLLRIRRPTLLVLAHVSYRSISLIPVPHELLCPVSACFFVLCCLLVFLSLTFSDYDTHCTGCFIVSPLPFWFLRGCSNELSFIREFQYRCLYPLYV